MRQRFSFRNTATGEYVAPHRIGFTEDDRRIFASFEGFEPAFPYDLDEDGNVVETFFKDFASENGFDLSEVWAPHDRNAEIYWQECDFEKAIEQLREGVALKKYLREVK